MIIFICGIVKDLQGDSLPVRGVEADVAAIREGSIYATAILILKYSKTLL